MRAVLFDMDGVLLDSERAVLAVWREIAGQLGLAEIEAVFVRCIGVNIRGTGEIFHRAYPAADFADFDRRVRARFQALHSGGRLPVKPGAKEILAALREREIPLALASSTRTETVRRELEEAGLLAYFDAVVGGDTVTRSKPDPEIFLAAAAKLSAEPAESFVIEDSFNGVRAAFAGGFRTLMVPDLIPPDAEMEEKTERILPDLFAARDWLLSVLRA